MTDFSCWGMFLLNHTPVEDIIEGIRVMHREHGFNRFWLAGIGLFVRIKGMAPVSEYEKMGRDILRIQAAVADEGVELGFWCTPTLKSGDGPGFEHITGTDGSVCKLSGCPLDPVWRKLFLDRLEAVMRTCGLKVMILEDDFQLTHHYQVHDGCLCKWHRAEFERRTGHPYADTPEDRTAMQTMRRDTLTDMAASIRRRMDAIDPTIRIGLCQPGGNHVNGEMTQPVTLALAGPNTRPFVRLCGTGYGSDDPFSIIHGLADLGNFCANLPPNVELIHETDSYPHNGFFMSARKHYSLLAGAVVLGCTGSLFIGAQNLEQPLEDMRYIAKYGRERKRLCAFKDAITDSQWIGYQVAMSGGNLWREVLGRLGIPCKTVPGSARLLCAGEIDAMSDAELEACLSGRVVLDGGAAQSAANRGYADWLGVDVRPNNVFNFCAERIEAAEVPGPRRMYNSGFAPAGPEGCVCLHLTLHKGARMWSSLLDPDQQVLQAAMTSFDNAHGGRVGVITYDLRHTRSSSIFCYRKQRLMGVFLEYIACVPMPMRVVDSPNVFTIARAKENELFACLINLSSDTVEDLKLHFADTPEEVSVLDEKGQWQNTGAVRLELMEPVFLRARFKNKVLG